MSASKSHTTVIEPASGWFSLNLGEVWRYRDLLLLLAWRDISARFRQSVIGYGWAVLRPLLTAAIFTLVFNVFVRVKTEVPYPIFAFAGLMPWLYFSTSLTGVTQSIVGGTSLSDQSVLPAPCVTAGKNRRGARRTVTAVSCPAGADGLVPVHSRLVHSGCPHFLYS